MVEPAVVRIDTVINYQHAIGAGTGIIIDGGGAILTNFHVVQGADHSRVSPTPSSRGWAGCIATHSSIRRRCWTDSCASPPNRACALQGK